MTTKNFALAWLLCASAFLASAAPDATTDPSAAEDLVDCQASLQQRKDAYRENMDRAQYWMAYLQIRRCAELMPSAELQLMAETAQIKSHIQDIESGNLAYGIAAIEALLRDFPAVGKKYASVLVSMKAMEQERKAKRAAEAARSALPLPRIGMSREQVTASRWGEPARRYRTTTAAGTTEQWVYGNGRYLYFTDGLLSAIQE